MKVLNVIPTLDPVSGGGTVERTFQLSRFLVECGAECSVLTTTFGLTEDRTREMAGVNIIALPCLNRRFLLPRPQFRRVRDAVRTADIVQLAQHWTMLNVLVWSSLRRFQKPYVVCPAGSLPRHFGRSKCKKACFDFLFGRRILENADGRIAITADEITQFAPYNLPDDGIAVIPNGVDPGAFDERDDAGFRRRYGLPAAPFVLFVGRLVPSKGIDLLVRAFCRKQDQFPGFHLAVAGPDGGVAAGLRKIAAESGLQDRVHFLGYIGGRDKSHAYQAADLLVIPSRHEAMSIVVLEAGCTGTPVLITDQCGFDEVEEVGGGRVVPATVEGIESGLCQLLPDGELRARMGQRLKDYTLKNFTWPNIARQHLELFQTLTGRRFSG